MISPGCFPSRHAKEEINLRFTVTEEQTIVKISILSV
jgi:hypothetical protein